jgi:hypothetical protein
MSQVQAFKERWREIYDREDARWSQVGHVRGEPSPASVATTIAEYKAAVAGMAEDRQARDRTHEAGYER